MPDDHEVTIDDWWRDSLQVNILAAGRRELGRWWRFDFTEGTSPWRLYRNDRPGASLLFPDGSTFEMPGGAVVVVPSGLPFMTQAWSPVQHFYIHFQLEGSDAWPAAFLEQPTSLGDPPLLRSLIASVREDHFSPDARQHLQWKLKAIVLESLAAMASMHRPQPAARASTSIQTGLWHALRYVQDNAHGPIQNADLARVSGMSIDHLIRTFRRKMGQTPGQYVIEYRTQLAANLLKTTDHTLDVVAEESGFTDRPHLTRVFRARFDMPPGAYRRLHSS